MRSMSSLPLCALVCLSLGSSILEAQGVAPTVRIVDRIDESNLVTLRGNTHPAANARNDRGRVSPELRMSDLILVLSRSPEQQAAFEKFVAGQYDANSPDFHQWLTPDEVGTKFGPSETDIDTISRWLIGHGLSVDQVTKDRMSIRFSGTAAQVESAFHTEIHNLEVKGVSHIGNMSDPQIPAALAPAVVGVKALHNFFPKPAHHLGSQVRKDAATGRWMRIPGAQAAGSATGTPSMRATLGGLAIGSPYSSGERAATAKPQYGIGVCGAAPNTYSCVEEDVAPFDFATIYNILPLWNATSPIDGTGQTIAIAGTSDICVGQNVPACIDSGSGSPNNDILVFRNTFGLPTTNSANTPKRIPGNSQPLTVCTDPGTENNPPPCTIDDLVENSLDVEWSGSIAKNAQIVLVASYAPPNSTVDGLYDSESYIVDNLTAPIMNVSYGECELANGTAGNVEYYDLWQTAAAEGISVFVAAGDSGSASCDDGEPVAESGLTVSGLASTPWNTAVGGTDFNWCNPDLFFNTVCVASPYWNSTNTSTGASVSTSGPQGGYVRETPWNESCANPLTTTWAADMANEIYGYPTSDVSSAEQACNFVADYTFTNAADSLANEYPYGEGLAETVGGGGGASGCIVGNAVVNPTTGEMTGCTAGSTSTGTTTNPDTGASQASISLNNNGWQKPSWQINSGIPGLPTSDGVRDLPDVSFFASDGYVSSSAYLMCASAVNTGNAPCAYSTYSEPFYQEVGGTSVATPAMAGVMALINQKEGAAQGFANPELYSLASKQNYSECSAETVAISSSCYFNDIDQGTNALPCDYAAFSSTITPNCKATQSTLGSADLIGILTGYNAGAGYDQATGLGSLNVANVVNGWVSTVGAGKTTVTVTPTPSTVTTSQSVSVLVTVGSSAAGAAAPSGSVTLYGGGYTSGPVQLSSGTYTFTIPAGGLSMGTDTLTASYPGDTIYAPSSGTGSVTVTGTGTQSGFTLSATSPAAIAPGSSATSTVSVSSTSNYTGTVTFPSTCAVTGYPTGVTSSAAGVSCSLTGSGTVTVANGVASGTATYTVSTTGTATAELVPARSPARLAARSNSSGWFETAGGTALAALLLLFAPVGSRKWRKTLSALLFLAAVTFAGVGCGGGGGGTTTPPVLATPVVAVTPTPTSIAASQTLSIAVAVSGSAGTPTGGVNVTGGGYSSPSQTLSSGSTTFSVPANSFTSIGTVTLTANYSGDSKYNPGSGANTITVSSGPTPAGTYTFTVTGNGNPAVTPAPTTTFTVTVN